LSYLEALEDVNIGPLMWAFRQAAKECEFFPKPVYLRRLANQCPRELLPAPDQRPMLPEGTYYEDGSRRLQEIIDGLVDDWGLPTTRTGRA
jgi:hypothetical protein